MQNRGGVAQVLLGIRSEARRLRFPPRRLPGAFTYLPQQSGYNKRLRTAVPLLKKVIRLLAVDTDLWTDATWAVDSTPVECARSREAAKRSELAGWAGYGSCSSHSGFSWGLRLHLMLILDHDPSVLIDRPALLIIGDKGYISRELDAFLAERGVPLLHPSYRSRTRPCSIAQRLLALTTAIRHNRATGRPTTRSLIAYGH